MANKTRITYSGSALPGNAEVVVLFNSTTAFGARAATHYSCYFFDVSLDVDQNTDNTVQLQVSDDGGTTFHLVGAAVAITNASAAGAAPVCFYVAPYADWQIVYTNGATPQTSFGVNMIIDHCSRGSVAASVTTAG